MTTTTTPSAKRRAVLYARFSTDLQDDRSIDDQFALARQHAARKGNDVVGEYSDRARSGATLHNRDGAIDMLNAARRREFDVIIVESLDRLSRDQEDLAGLFKRLTFYGVELDTLNDGIATPIHVGVRGLIGQMELANTAARVRRGLLGRVREGKFPGTVVYGYRRVLGKPGEREIDEAQAEIVRRIFREYVAGTSPRSIAKALNEEGVPAPVGTQWNNQSFVGSKFNRGILRNPIYIGRIIWNTARRELNPDTGRKVKRLTAESDWTIVEAPQWRIIDQDLWERAQAVREKRAIQKFGPGGKVARRPFIARSPHLLAGILRCGACGSIMRVSNTAKGYAPRAQCSTAAKPSAKIICEHTRSYDMGRLQVAIVNSMRETLTDPAAIAAAVAAFHKVMGEDEKKRRGEYAAARKRLTNIEAATLRLVDALEKGSMPSEVIIERLQGLEAERVGLAERIRLGADDPRNVTVMHPQARERYLASIETLADALQRDQLDPEARMAFQNVVEAVQVHPVEKRAPYEYNIHLRHEALLGDLNLFPVRQSTREIIAARTDVALFDSARPGSPGLAMSNKAKPLNIGRFIERRAA